VSNIQTAKKSHKAILGALYLSGKPLLPCRVPQSKTQRVLWTVEFLAPAGPVWDTKHPLIIEERTVQEMLNNGYLTHTHDCCLELSGLGCGVAKRTQTDWFAYWDMFYNDRRSGRKPFNWVEYFKTGIYNMEI
jgi:hypothetical protein